MTENLFCSGHREVKADIERIERTQEARHCLANERAITSLEKSDDLQWTEINKLKRLVYLGVGGVGAAAFFGSIIGNLIISYLRK